jgi:dynein heavy chain, axonemal
MMPASESVYEWVLDTETMQWVDWMATIPDFKCNPDKPFADIIVPTSDTVRYTHVMRSLLLGGHHVLAVGDTGTGKTLAVQARLSSDRSSLLEQPVGGATRPAAVRVVAPARKPL